MVKCKISNYFTNFSVIHNRKIFGYKLRSFDRYSVTYTDIRGLRLSLKCELSSVIMLKRLTPELSLVSYKQT